MTAENINNTTERALPINPQHDEKHAASKGELKKAHHQMTAPSKDWTKLANILRRSCGGFSRSRSSRLTSIPSKRNEK
ncbi:hypothetical protein [Ochrobactrum quorumnocens]|jgi:hypothetical protein|uniref:Uncharacterized protein n=1 Tax=Ochrobactrum quorumnocens TaxID=271865 RepID=A0A5N1K122_9HYPH|nr:MULTISPECIES: hypothetical protein [Brucella]KAA9369986.1 hypothetical protein F3W84_03670 [[Ochrobactrum] quorumnocens]MBD7993542.1 hypothetical protein [Ochrobactrum gallinarum]MCV9906915.1 hypothetical protein [Brucella sp. HL-2]